MLENENAEKFYRTSVVEYLLGRSIELRGLHG
jgi:hypothetical protein